MCVIKAITRREAAFVYHMLSAARCGYDNAYGTQYAGLHDAGDLAALKAMEPLLTVRGGSHQGALYRPLVAAPAAMSTPAGDFYRNYPAALAPHSPHRNEVLALCAVMERAYPVYLRQVWPQIRPVLEDYAGQVQQALDIGDRPQALTEQIGGAGAAGSFYPCFCLGLEGGAEAIDIAADIHIFGIERDMDWAARFVLHEYAIYLLKDALRGTPAFSDHRYWPYTEALADHYLGVLGLGGAMALPPEIIGLYANLAARSPELLPRELFLRALALSATL